MRQRGSRLVAAWKDDPSNPGRLDPGDRRVRQLIADLAPDARAEDLGGTFSLNVRLGPQGLVLRVHQPWVSRARLLALQRLRAALAGSGLLVPTAVAVRRTTVLRADDRWAEVEPFVAAEKPRPSVDAYRWLFTALGLLHRHLARLDVQVPRPLVATWATPGSLATWLKLAEPTIESVAGPDHVARIVALRGRLASRWPPLGALPWQIIHGDARLGNVRRTSGGEPLYLDFGFAAHRPRVYDVAYSLLYMVLALGRQDDPASFDWALVAGMVDAYERAAGWRLSDAERAALAPFMAIVPLYHAVTAGLMLEPEPAVRNAVGALSLSEWLLRHPEAVAVSR